MFNNIRNLKTLIKDRKKIKDLISEDFETPVLDKLIEDRKSNLSDFDRGFLTGYADSLNNTERRFKMSFEDQVDYEAGYHAGFTERCLNYD